eukprot:4491909-Pyramimonas_sp.AAC.1
MHPAKRRVPGGSGSWTPRLSLGPAAHPESGSGGAGALGRAPVAKQLRRSSRTMFLPRLPFPSQK